MPTGQTPRPCGAVFLVLPRRRRGGFDLPPFPGTSRAHSPSLSSVPRAKRVVNPIRVEREQFLARNNKEVAPEAPCLPDQPVSHSRLLHDYGWSFSVTCSGQRIVATGDNPILILIGTKLDGFVRSPSAALRFIFRHCSVPLCTPHSSKFARLVPPVAGELFTVPSPLATSYEVIKLADS